MDKKATNRLLSRNYRVIFFIFLLVLLPLVGFYLGNRYQPKKDTLDTQVQNVSLPHIDGWKVFTNSQFSFVFEYPQSWVLNEHKSSDEYNIQILHPGYQGNYLPDISIIISNQPEFNDNFKSNVFFDGIPAYAYSTPNGEVAATEWVEFKKNNYNYRMYLLHNDGTTGGLPQNSFDKYSVYIFYQILSSFKFTK